MNAKYPAGRSLSMAQKVFTKHGGSGLEHSEAPRMYVAAEEWSKRRRGPPVWAIKHAAEEGQKRACPGIC